MSQYKYAEIADTVYFWFAANDTTGTAGDGATPLYDVRLAGAASDAAPTASGTPTLLSHANYSAGLHEIAIDTTGYAAGEYAVFCTLTISAVNPAGFCGSFKLRTAGTAALNVNTTHVAGTAQTAGDIPAKITTAQNDLDILTGTDGVTLATAQAKYAPNKIVPDAAGTAAGLHAITDGLVTTVDTVVDAIKLKTDTLGGAGAITWTYTLTNATTSAPIPGANIWATTDLAGANIAASGVTDDLGVVTFYLDAGTWYIWRSRSGYNFSNPDIEVVS